MSTTSPVHRTTSRQHAAHHSNGSTHATAPSDVEKLENHPHEPRPSFWSRFKGIGRKRVGVRKSLWAIATHSWLNVFLICIPIAWAAHWVGRSDERHEELGRHGHFSDPGFIFAMSFLSIIPLEKMLDFGGEQLSLYCGRELGDLVIISLNNVVEATLAIIMLTKCDLKLLQSTIAGVVLLHLLLVPGVAFVTGGARIWEQNLHPHTSQLNQTLLTIGILSLLIPAAFFAALDPAAVSAEGADSIVSDMVRHQFLQFSRGIAIILLIVYFCSRFFLYNPPGENNALQPAPNAPQEIRHLEHKLLHEEPEVGPWVCVVFLVIVVAITAVTAEWLVESIDFVRENANIKLEWFGIILIPLVSFSGDATVAIVYFIRAALFMAPEAPPTLAKPQQARAIDLSIQFTLFWMPFLVLLAWWTDRPLTLLFDLYEVTILVGAAFLVNYVTADAKTNWAEGVILVAFYVMIALTSWFYPGQTAVEQLLDCRTVAEAVAAGAGVGD